MDLCCAGWGGGERMDRPTQKKSVRRVKLLCVIPNREYTSLPICQSPQNLHPQKEPEIKLWVWGGVIYHHTFIGSNTFLAGRVTMEVAIVCEAGVR